MKKLWVEASNFDESYNKAIKELRDDALELFLTDDIDEVEVEYGTCKPYEYNYSTDYECEELGEFNISFSDFDYSADEVREMALEILDER